MKTSKIVQKPIWTTCPELKELCVSLRVGSLSTCPPLRGVGQLDKFSPECPNGLIGQYGQVDKRKKLLDSYRLKQEFRCSVGKSKWINYEQFNPKFNLRLILDDEIAIEFDMPEDYKGGIPKFREEISWPAINFTGVSLWKAGISFEVWDHGGKSPHIHIHDLPISGLSPEKRSIFKKFFIRKYVPLEYLDYVDTSLCGIHLIALEWAEHWKGCYGVKELVHKLEAEV